MDGMMVEQKVMTSPAIKEFEKKVERLEKEANLQRSILEVIKEPFFVLNRKGEFLKVSPMGIEMLGYSWDELQEMVFMDVVALEDLSRFREGFGQMGEGNEVQLEGRIIVRDGEHIPIKFFGDTREEYLFVTLRDLREKIKTEGELDKDQLVQQLQVLRNLYDEKVKEIEKLREEAALSSYIDDLTGIYNHRFFIQQLNLEIKRQKRYPTPLSLLMIDIDYFKHYNDTNGHLAGDQALRAIAMLIQHGVRQTDMIARYGGEEFSAILINAEKEGARKMAERVRRNVAETRFPNESFQPDGDLTVSIGVATFSSAASTPTDLIHEADNALYRAKKAGRNRVEG